MKCDDCVFYLDKLDTCMFCSFISANDMSSDYQKGMKNRLGYYYKDYVESLMFKPMIPICKDQEKDEFDILKFDDDYCGEWNHKKILKRLHNNGIDCFFVDMWGCDEIAYITGIKADEDEVARVLNLHEECVYYDYEYNFMILNLFQEKVLRENGA